MVRWLHENHFIIFDWIHAKLSETFLAVFKYCVRILSHFFFLQQKRAQSVKQVLSYKSTLHWINFFMTYRPKAQGCDGKEKHLFSLSSYAPNNCIMNGLYLRRIEYWLYWKYIPFAAYDDSYHFHRA